MSVCLTEEQKRRIEENRQKALARRAERLASQKDGIYHNAPAGGKHLPNTRPAFSAKEPGKVDGIKSVPPDTRNISANASNNTQATKTPPTTQTPQEYTASNKPQAAKGEYTTANPAVTAGRTFQPDDAKHVLQDSSKTAGDSSKTHDVHSGSGTAGAEPVKSTNAAAKFYGLGTTAMGAKANVPAPRTEAREMVGGASSAEAAPAKKNLAGVKGRCVKHADERFRVEVGYNPELIALFKGIPSKNYGKCVRTGYQCVRALGTPECLIIWHYEDLIIQNT